MANETLYIGSRVRHPEFGDGVIVQVKSDAYLVTFIEKGMRPIARNYDKLEIIDAIEAPDDLYSWEDMERALVKVLRRFSDVQETVPLHNKWAGGKIMFIPAQKDQQPKEMPIDSFFNKIIMTRDRLRVMEQRINASNLSDEEKINLQQYITRIYGSLTSFNMLFKNRDDYFEGVSEK